VRPGDPVALVRTTRRATGLAAAWAGVLAAVVLALPASAQEARTYHVRPAPVLACGGPTGGCRVLTIQGSLDLAGFEIVATQLVLHDRDGNANPFPAPGDLPLTSAVRRFDRLVSPPKAPQSFEFLWRSPFGSSPPRAFVLHGTYDEGCCQRFRYDLNVLFVLPGSGSGQELRLVRDTFRIGVRWTDHQGGTGVGTAAPLDGRSGSFWFFRSDNPELLVKVIDACDFVGHWWFFAAGLTDLGVEIRVEGPDGAVRTYESPVGEPFAPIQDTAAFPCLEP
jgi:hypothetical protein